MTKTTRYFVEQVLPRRPDVTVELCLAVIAAPIRREIQDDGRIRVWGEATRDGEPNARVLRVVLLDDEETIHNAFFDRGFWRKTP